MTSPTNAKLVVLAGPSGVGKGTVVRRLRELHPDVYVSVSVTTRPPRPGEVEGRDYFFISADRFDSLIESDGLLEWALVHGVHRYGTPAEPVCEQLEAGHSVLVEIDLAGARQVRAARPDAVTVFLEPPSIDELIRRLVGRATESQEEVDRRLLTARREMASRSEFDHVIRNIDVDQAARELAAILGLD
ncbi:guanylate kinase [Nanchangia anserum]|uniref:Guanylate kinase n=1 Tax=Nanchangia anserum TaxID=2692125 RepID=A0A8I0GC19_9ACTO|nr:guanylate kinase [Nanchangia anserum]MBD3688788.1 guanylate kinase [Nanchangia anserum]QOX82522.1 guanylate kinase [Nanchangia anserum]